MKDPRDLRDLTIHGVKMEKKRWVTTSWTESCLSQSPWDHTAFRGRAVFFFFTLVTGPRRSLSLNLSDTRVNEPQIRARRRAV